MHGDPRRHVPLPEPARGQPAVTHTGTHDTLRFWYRYGRCRPGRHQISPRTGTRPGVTTFCWRLAGGPPPRAARIAGADAHMGAPNRIAFSKSALMPMLRTPSPVRRA